MRLEIDDNSHLRLLEEADAEELYRLVDGNRAHLVEWMPWGAGQTFEQTANFIRGALRRHAERDGSELALMLDGRMIGAAGFAGIDWVARSWTTRSESSSCTASRSRRRRATAGAARSPSGSASSRRGSCARPNAWTAATWTWSSTACSPALSRSRRGPATAS